MEPLLMRDSWGQREQELHQRVDLVARILATIIMLVHETKKCHPRLTVSVAL